ncbi:MAG: hypothetical protein GXP53_06570 [Deltaproteobacteria bacterium]|nr:hypothetical protein [Deltaproteobacteria bacterium]
MLLGANAVFAQGEKPEKITVQSDKIMADSMTKDNIGAMGDVMMKMQKKLSKGQMSPADTQKMCGMMRNMAKMMHEMKSGCSCATLKEHRTVMETYEKDLEKMGSEF